MTTSGPVAESPIECALRLANGAVEKELLDLMMKFSLTQGGLVDVAPVFQHFVDGGAVAEGQFLRLSRLLVAIVPAADALDEEALREAIDAQVGRRTARILTAEHAVAIALRTGRPRDHMKIARVLASAPEAVDRRKLEGILGRHGLLDAWRRLQPTL